VLTLDEPFARWRVEVAAQADERVQAIDFDSAVLGRRTRALAWVPPASEPSVPMPVVYFLHGTVATTMPAPATRALEARAQRGKPVLHAPSSPPASRGRATRARRGQRVAATSPTVTGCGALANWGQLLAESAICCPQNDRGPDGRPRPPT
jgi:hypothetical protein